MKDYFVNHGRVRQFPWSLYHAPLEDDLSRFLQSVSKRHRAPEILVVGCGTLSELDCIPKAAKVTVVDIDPRAVQSVAQRQDARIVRCEVVSADQGPSSLGATFDAIYAKEVIEHVPMWQPYLRELRDCLKPGGELWLSTPNYGEPWLASVEYTVLEVIARAQGFTRFGMHPSRFSRRGLQRGLQQAGFDSVEVHRKAWHFALVARATKPVDAPGAASQKH